MNKTLPKILVIGTTDCVGGAARVGWDLGHELMKRGYEVKYIVGYKKSDKKYVHELHKPKMLKWIDEHTKYNATGLLRHFRSFILANNIDFGASEEILNHSWYKAADIIHCHNLHGNFFKLETLVKISREKKLVWTLHDMSAVTGKCAYTTNFDTGVNKYHKCQNLMSYPPMLWDNTRYMWNKKKSIYDKCKFITIVTPSKWLENIIKESILSKHQIKTIYNGIDTKVFKNTDKEKARKDLNLPSNKKLVLYIAHGGTSDPRKGWKYTAELIEKYKNENVQFICIGGGGSSERSNITYVGHISDRKLIAKYYSASDVLLFTSLAENCPLVVLEAMCAGLPIVSFDVGGVNELVKHKINGYIAEYKKVNDLYSGLSYILNKTELSRTKIKSANSKLVKSKYSIHKMTTQYENLYNKL